MTDRLVRGRRAAGIPASEELVRAPSYANEVWVGRDVVLRLNARGDGSLRREAAIAARVPDAVRYPAILASGAEADLDWMVTRRVAGVALGAAWPSLSAAHRERAIRELAEALCALHAAPAGGLPGDRDLAPPHVLPLDRLLELAARVAGEGVDPALLREVERFVRARWDAFDGGGPSAGGGPDDGLVLVHGDPHLENVLWDGDHVSAVLDLEWSRRSWPEVDLEILLSICSEPALFATIGEEALAPEQFIDVPRWLAGAAPAWFQHPRLRDRLDVLRVSRTLTCLEEFPSSELRIAHLRELLAGGGPFRRWR
jgi:aminoglycoside phosphotransferase